jgi:hypothetical protein
MPLVKVELSKGEELSRIEINSFTKGIGDVAEVRSLGRSAIYRGRIAKVKRLIPDPEEGSVTSSSFQLYRRSGRVEHAQVQTFTKEDINSPAGRKELVIRRRYRFQSREIRFEWE